MKDDKYCPDCLCQLNKGIDGYYWCPNHLDCGYELDLNKRGTTDTSLNEFEAKKSKLNSLEREYLKVKSEYESALMEYRKGVKR